MEQTRIQKINKTVFVNTLLHVEVHNRMQEEQEMWKQHEAAKKQGSKRKSHTELKLHKKHKKSDKETVDVSNKKYCKVEKIKTDCTSSERWGHSGFVELYPDEIISGQYLQVTGTSEELQENGKNNSHKKKKKKSKHKKKKR